MSGVLIKTGIYGIVRFCAFGLGTPRLSWGVIVVAVERLPREEVVHYGVITPEPVEDRVVDGLERILAPARRRLARLPDGGRA